MAATPPPPPVTRPRLAVYLFDRGLSFRDLTHARGGPLARSHEYARRLCLPFSDALRIAPTPAEVEQLATWSAGEIAASDFEPPNGEPVSMARVLAGARAS